MPPSTRRRIVCTGVARKAKESGGLNVLVTMYRVTNLEKYWMVVLDHGHPAHFVSGWVGEVY